MMTEKVAQRLAMLTAHVEHERDCYRYEQGLSHTDPGQCNCHVHDIIAVLHRYHTALDKLLDWALSNRGSKHEFVTCRSDGDIHDPALIEARMLSEGSDD